MQVIGIDPSLTATGLIIIKNGELNWQKTIKTKPSGDDFVKELERLLTIVKLIPIDGVDLAVIEGISFMARATSSLAQLSALNYFIRRALYENNTKFVVVAPSTLKKFVTGKGNCPKDLMFLETYKRYDVSFSDNNLCDAFGLAKIGEALTTPGIELTKFQEEVINLLKKQYVPR